MIPNGVGCYGPVPARVPRAWDAAPRRAVTAEQDQAPLAAPGLGRVAGQAGQRRLPLQQFHGLSAGHAGGFVPICDLVRYGIRATLPER